MSLWPSFRFPEDVSDLPEGKGSCKPEKHNLLRSLVQNVHFPEQFHLLFPDRDSLGQICAGGGKLFI